jgi:hypothetical protein
MALDAAGADQSNEYGRTILRLLENFTRSAVAPGLLGILESKKQLQQRIRTIAEYVPGRRWQLSALAVVAGIAVTGLTDARDKVAVAERTEAIQSATRTSEVQTNQGAAVAPRPVVTNGPIMKVVVLESATGQPLADAEVLAPNWAGFWGGPENAPHWLTDRDGVALIHLGEAPSEHLAVMSWFTVSVKHQGYAPRGLSWAGDNKDARPTMPREITVRLDKGMTVGGVVRDEGGVALTGVQIRLFGTGHWEGFRHEYPEFWTDSVHSRKVVTDSKGQWQARDFPPDLEAMKIELIRPDGSWQRYRKMNAGSEQDPREPGEPIDLAALRAGKAEFVLKSGTDMSGVVVDPAGKPVPGVLVEAGTGMVNRRRLQECRTDAGGRFQFHHLVARQLILTAYFDRFAITSMVVDLPAPEIRLQFAPLRPLRIHVLDGEGRQVAGAKIGLDWYRTESQLLDFAGETGLDGILVWTNAPVSSFGLVASSASGRFQQKIRVVPGQQEATFRLREGMSQEVIINGHVRDAKTGAPVGLESVSYQTGPFDGFKDDGETFEGGFRLAIPATLFRPQGMYPSYHLQFCAHGYSLLVTPWRDFDEGDWEADFVMQPAIESSRTVLLPDGRAAAGARVWTRPDVSYGTLYCFYPNNYSDDRWIKLPVDDQGRFAVPTLPDDQPVVLAHPNGYLETSLAELKGNSIVRLQPWGKVEGVLRTAGQPKAGAEIAFVTLHPSPGMIFLNYSGTTAPDGNFSFSNVPAGEYKIYRHRPWRTERTGVRAEDHQMVFTVKPGETVRVTDGGSGRIVIGKAKAENRELALDWLNDDHTLTLKQPTLQPPNNDDFASPEKLRQAYSRFDRSPERIKLAREARTYVLVFEPDSSFRADDIPPGTYELRILVNKPGERGRLGPLASPQGSLGSLVREVVVPPGDVPFSLGTLIVPMNDAKAVNGAQKL